MAIDTVLCLGLSSIVTFPFVAWVLYAYCDGLVVSTKGSHLLSLTRHQTFCCWESACAV